MLHEFSRSQLLLGKEGIEKLKKSCVAVFGIGGVGGYTVEALARTGVGKLILIDNDTVSLTNINRQIIATHESIGRLKTEVMRERILQINPGAQVELHSIFFLADTPDDFLDSCDYIVDAVDTVAAKLHIVEAAQKRGIPVISSMGAGNKLDPTRFEIADIYSTSVCPLCRVMRRELKKRGIPVLKVVYSKEPSAPREEDTEVQSDSTKRQTPGSLAYVPSVAGLFLASEVIRDLTEAYRPKEKI